MPKIKLSQLPEGGIIELPEIPILLARFKGVLTALESTCTHDGCNVAFGEISGNNIVCPCHGSTFDLITGEVRGGPATVPLKKHDVRVIGDEVIVE